jgi:uncharacterized membrane protein
MLILIIVIITTLLARLLGVGGIAALDSWPPATRVGLCGMFFFTAAAHFTSVRHDLARMLPPTIRYPIAVIYFTGVCEIFGAIGLLLPSTRIYAAIR